MTTFFGIDATPTLNADGTLTLTMRSPVQMRLHTGIGDGSNTDRTEFGGGSGPVTTFARSTQTVEVKTMTKEDEITTTTQNTEIVVTLKDNGTIAMRGIRTRTIKQGDRVITLWSYVPTLGRLLNNDEGTEPEKELVVFVTARVIRP